MAKFTWNGPQMQAAIARKVGQRLDAASAVVQDHAKKLISVDGTTAVGTGRRKKLRYNTNPSLPGEPPHVQTGRLRSSVAREREGVVARVGTNVVYGRYLELGTADVAARPWLRRALLESTPAVRAILSTPMDI